MDFVPESYKPDMATRHLRETLRYRASLVRIRTAIKNKVHAMLAKLNISHGYSDLFGKKGLDLPWPHSNSPRSTEGHWTAIFPCLEALNLQIKCTDELLKEVYEHSEDAWLLATIPGVGPITALTILAEIGDINRFGSAKKLASFAGLVPSTSQSGDHSWHGAHHAPGFPLAAVEPWLKLPSTPPTNPEP